MEGIQWFLGTLEKYSKFKDCNPTLLSYQYISNSVFPLISFHDFLKTDEAVIMRHGKAAENIQGQDIRS